MGSDFSAKAAAAWLHQRKVSREPFAALSGGHVPPTMGQAYDVADQYVGLCCTHENARPVGYKIALTTPQMRAFVGYSDSVAGSVLSTTTYASGAALSFRLRAAQEGKRNANIAFRNRVRRCERT